MKEDKPMTIGQVAKQAGVGVETIRFYEREGLLQKPKRKPSGYRLFGPEIIAQLKFIKRVQEFGFSLNDVRQILKKGNGSALKAIDHRIAELQAFRKECAGARA